MPCKDCAAAGERDQEIAALKEKLEYFTTGADRAREVIDALTENEVLRKQLAEAQVRLGHWEDGCESVVKPWRDKAQKAESARQAQERRVVDAEYATEQQRKRAEEAEALEKKNLLELNRAKADVDNLSGIIQRQAAELAQVTRTAGAKEHLLMAAGEREATLTRALEACYKAMKRGRDLVEEGPGHPKLTEAVIILGDAIDAINRCPHGFNREHCGSPLRP